MKKRDFIILPGTGRSEIFYQEFVEALRKEPVAHDVFVIDNLGFGKFRNISSPWKMSDFVQHADSQLKKMKLSSKRPKTVIGHSLGASIAMAWAIHSPDLFHEYVLINTAIGSFNPIFRGQYSLIVKFALARLLLKPQQMDAVVLSQTINNPDILQKFVQAKAAKARQPISFQYCAKQILAGLVYFPIFFPKKTRGLVLYAENDRFISPKNSSSLIKHLQLHSASHPTAGHDLPQEEPTFCAKQITRFIQASN